MPHELGEVETYELLGIVDVDGLGELVVRLRADLTDEVTELREESHHHQIFVVVEDELDNLHFFCECETLLIVI